MRAKKGGAQVDIVVDVAGGEDNAADFCDGVAGKPRPDAFYHGGGVRFDASIHFLSSSLVVSGVC
jgi:hypothetical protein